MVIIQRNTTRKVKTGCRGKSFPNVFIIKKSCQITNVYACTKLKHMRILIKHSQTGFKCNYPLAPSKKKTPLYKCFQDFTQQRGITFIRLIEGFVKLSRLSFHYGIFGVLKFQIVKSVDVSENNILLILHFIIQEYRKQCSGNSIQIKVVTVYLTIISI